MKTGTSFETHSRTEIFVDGTCGAAEYHPAPWGTDDPTPNSVTQRVSVHGTPKFI